MEYNILFGEIIGTMILIIFGVGTNAANSLNKSYAKGSGWVFIVFGWGLGVFAGSLVSNPLSGGHLNPAVSFTLLLQNSITLSQFFTYFIAQIVGSFLGAAVVYQLYYDHFQETEGHLGTVFYTGPSILNYTRNMLSEIIGTFILVIFILQLSSDSSATSMFVPLVVVGIGICLGSLTGYAINPARDFGPRLLYSFTKLANKHKTDWKYAVIPFIGPLLGGAISYFVFNIMENLI